MTLKWIVPFASALALAASIPALAASHGVGHHGKASSATLPNQASSTANRAVMRGQVSPSSSDASVSVAPPSLSTSTSPPGRRSTSHPHGPPAQVQQEVQAIRTLRAEIQAARQHYLTTVQTYIQTLSSTLTSGQASTLNTALMQLKSINTTLAQAVKTEMAAQQAQSSAGVDVSSKGSQTALPAGSPQGLSDVVLKFQAELAALQTATKQVQHLTGQLAAQSSSGSRTTPTSSSTTTSSSAS